MAKEIPKPKFFQLIIGCFLISCSVGVARSRESPAQTDVDMAVIGAHHEAISIQDQVTALQNRIEILEKRLPSLHHYTEAEIKDIDATTGYNKCTEKCFDSCKGRNCGENGFLKKQIADCLAKCNPLLNH